MSKRTPAQEWASQRNWLKSDLKGICSKMDKAIRSDLLTPQEKAHVGEIFLKAKFLLDNWNLNNESSKRQFLASVNKEEK